MDGHRRIANSLFLRHRPLKRPYTEIEALVSIDLDVSARGGLKSVAEYARIFGHSRNWCRTRIGQYVDTQEALKVKRKHPSKDSDRTPVEHPSDRHRTPTKILIQSLDPEEEKKEPAAVAAPRSKLGKTKFPEPFPQNLRSDLETWAPRSGFVSAQVERAIVVVGDWAVSNGKVKADWKRTIQGAMRAGWALNIKPRPDGTAPPQSEAPRREYSDFTPDTEPKPTEAEVVELKDAIRRRREGAG